MCRSVRVLGCFFASIFGRVGIMSNKLDGINDVIKTARLIAVQSHNKTHIYTHQTDQYRYYISSSIHKA